MKVVLSFGINNYPRAEERLRGCCNDVDNMKALFENLNKVNKEYVASLPKGEEYDKTLFEPFVIKTFKDSEVTIENFKKAIKSNSKDLKAGDMLVIHYSGHGTQVWDKDGDETDSLDEALYLYDGSFIDDDFYKLLKSIKEGVKIVVLLDCCFSGTATRTVDKSRFVKTISFDIFPVKIRKRFIKRDKEISWLVMSACSENETSADAKLENTYQGAFTYVFCKTFVPAISVIQLYRRIRKHLPSGRLTQTPTIEGDPKLFKTRLF